MHKKFLGLILSLCMIMSLIVFPTNVSAEIKNWALASNGTTVSATNTADPANVIDGSTSTYGYVRANGSMTLTFANHVDLTRVNVLGNGQSYAYWSVEGSIDGTEWFTVGYKGLTYNESSVKNGLYFEPATGTTATAKYLKVTNETTSANFVVYEIEVYGEMDSSSMESDPYLESMTFSPETGELSPAFDKEIKDYVLYVDSMDNLPEIIAEAPSSDYNVVIEQADAENNYLATITVTHIQNAALSETYKVQYELVFPDSTLSSLTVTDGTLSPAFDKNIKDYILHVDSLDNLPEITAEATSSNCTVGIEHASAENDYIATIKLTNSNTGTLLATYTVQYKLVTPDSTLSSLNASGGTLKPAFDKNTTNYTLEVDSLSTLPIISATASLTSSRVEIEHASADNGYTATVVVTSKQNTTTTYTVRFVVPAVPAYYSSLGLHYDVVSCEPDGSNLNISDWELLKDGSSVGVYKANNPVTSRPSAILDLGAFYLVSDAVMYHYTAAGGIADPQYQYSVDGKVWYDLTGTTKAEKNDQTSYYIKERLLRHFTPNNKQVARYIRVTISPVSSGLFNPGELCIYGEPVDTLKTISVDGAELRPAFDSSVTEYEVFVPSLDRQLPIIKAELYEDSKSSISIVQASAQNDYSASVTVNIPGNYSLTYKIKYKEYNPGSADLKSIKLSLNGEEPVELAGFDKNKTEYIHYIKDINSIPTVSAETDNPTATITSLKQATKKYTVATISVMSEDETVEKTYTVIFASNIALNSPAWGVTPYSGMDPKYAVDGNLDTLYWSSAATASNGYLRIDLETISDIYGVTLYTTQTSNTGYHGKLSISEDGETWTEVEGAKLNYVLQTSDSGGTVIHKMEFSFEQLPLKSKYIQVSGKIANADKMRVSELEVYGVSAPIVSSNCFINALELSSGQLPGFSKYINSYTVKLGENDAIPTVSVAQAEDSAAVVTIEQATESNPVAKITVLAENKTSQMTYTISFEKQLAPGKNTYLSSLNFAKGTLLPAFSPANTSYTLYLHSGESITNEDVSAIAVVSGASVNITEGNPVLVKVTSSDGTENRTYTIATEYAEADLAELTVTGYEITPAFSPEVTDYSVELQPNEDIPFLGVELDGKIIKPIASDGTSISIVQATAENPKAIITVENENGILKKNYTISFNYVQSLEKAYDSVQCALRDFAATNDTTADDILQLVKKSITNEEIDAIWSTAFSKKKATTVDTGLITGAITLKFGEESVVITVRKSIAKETGGPGGGSSGGGGGGGSSSGEDNSSSSNDSNKEEKPPVVTDKYQEIRNHWAVNEVIYLAENGIVEGNGNSFALEDSVTRAEFVTMLIRAGKFDLAAYNNSFGDVSENDWYAQYVQTAFNNGFISGYDGKVNPVNTTTREEAVKMLVNVYENMNSEIVVESEKVFSDSSTISQWAEEFVQKSVAANLVQGFDTGEFKAKDTLTRAQAMVMIYRLITK